MTKIAQVVGLSLEARLEHARSEIEKLERDRETLQETRGRRLIDGDPAELLQIEAAIGDKDRALVLMRERYAALLAAQDQAAADQRLKDRDKAIETLRPELEEICALVEAFETKLVEAAAAKAKVDARFETYRNGWPRGLPHLPAYSDFTLNGFTARLKTALEHSVRDGFDRMDYLIDDVAGGERRRPSQLLRERAATFIADLRTKVHEAEQANVAAE
jgi:hypothetical protein